MTSMRTKHAPAFKVRVALKAYREEKTSSELAGLYQVHPGLIRNWKNILIKGASNIFNGNSQIDKDQAKLIEELYRQIGQLKVELDWLKKIWNYPIGRGRCLPAWRQTGRK